MRDREHIPFSWTLLCIALLHFSVWSIGVCESHSKAFFVREQQNQKSIHLSRFDQHIETQQNYYYCILEQQQSESARQAREYQSRTLSHKNSKLDSASVPVTSTQLVFLQSLFVLSGFASTATSSDSSSSSANRRNTRSSLLLSGLLSIIYELNSISSITSFH